MLDLDAGPADEERRWVSSIIDILGEVTFFNEEIHDESKEGRTSSVFCEATISERVLDILEWLEQLPDCQRGLGAQSHWQLSSSWIHTLKIGMCPLLKPLALLLL